MIRIFISYSSRDEAAARLLKSRLDAETYEVVVPDRKGKSRRPANIEPGLADPRVESCDAVLLLISPFWHKCPECLAECDTARTRDIVVLAVTEAPAAKRLPVPDIEEFDLTRDREGGLDRLVRRLGEIPEASDDRSRIPQPKEEEPAADIPSGDAGLGESKNNTAPDLGDTPKTDRHTARWRQTIIPAQAAIKMAATKVGQAARRIDAHLTISGLRELLVRNIARTGVPKRIGRWRQHRQRSTDKVGLFARPGEKRKIEQPSSRHASVAQQAESEGEDSVKPLSSVAAIPAKPVGEKPVPAQTPLPPRPPVLARQKKQTIDYRAHAVSVLKTFWRWLRITLARLWKRTRFRIYILAGVAMAAGVAWVGIDKARTVFERRAMKSALTEVQIRQSKFLAKAAKFKLDAGDAATSALLGIEALPDLKAGVDRPLVLEAKSVTYGALQALDRLSVLKGHGNVVYDAQFSTDGRRIVTASWDNTARVWNARNSTQIAVFSGHENYLKRAAFSPDGKRIVTASLDETARLWNVASGAQMALLEGHRNSVNDAAFSPDGKLIATGSGDNTVQLWNAVTGAQIAVLRDHRGDVESVAFSPDGRMVASGSADRTVRLWDLETRQVKAQLIGHRLTVTAVAFSPDGKRLATASNDRTARIWDIATARQIAVLEGHRNMLNDIAFSPDGRLLVTASADNTARIWDAATFEPLDILSGHRDVVNSVVFDPKGKRILTASSDGTARIWPVFQSPQALVEKAKKIVPHCLSPQQRKQYFLEATPPRWCIRLGKWPYDSQAWKKWLKAIKAGRSPPMPQLAK